MPTPLELVEIGRNALLSLEKNYASRLATWQFERQRLDAALRTGDATQIAVAQSAFDSANFQYTTFRDLLYDSIPGHRQQIQTWLNTFASQEEEYSRLDAVPIVMFPVRLETRFNTTSQHLHVRIFPDVIVSDGAEREITPIEFEARTVFDAGGRTFEAWQDLVTRFGETRAQFIVQWPAIVSGDGPMPNPFRGNSDWTHPVRSWVLPDRWIAVGYPPNGSPVVVRGNAIVQPLAMSLDPHGALTNEEDETKLSDDAGSRWMNDFDHAESVGMAIKMPYSGTAGFDRLVVVGVKGSLTPSASAEFVRNLFEGHAVNDGFSITRQGTPTNNTGNVSADFWKPDPGARKTYDRAVGPLPGDLNSGEHRRDAELLREALGFETYRIDGALDYQIEAGRWMNEALWPATWGYFLEHMCGPHKLGGAPGIGEEFVNDLRELFVSHVRGRGTAPCVRIGSTPYGVLPAVSLSEWDHGESPPLIYSVLVDKLKLMRMVWQNASRNVPRVKKNPTDPKRDLMRILGMVPSANQARLRHAIGDVTAFHTWQLASRTTNALVSLRARLATDRALSLIDEAGGDLRLHHTLEAKDALRVHGNFVVPDGTETWPMPETNDLNRSTIEGSALEWSTASHRVPNYIDLIVEAPIAELWDPDFLPTDAPLLARLLRHSLLNEYVRLAIKRLRDFNGITPNPPPVNPAANATSYLIYEVLRETFFVGPSRLQLFDLPDPGSTDVGVKLSDYVRQETLRGNDEGRPRMRDYMKLLAGCSQAELHRLFTETLDISTHRLDAWITGLAASRLDDLRWGDGFHADEWIGGYGWLENVRPPSAVAATETLSDGRVVEVQADNGGFIHAPSMSHATAAAMMRSAQLTYKNGAASRYDLDLSSRRVRLAKEIADAVRNGQPLGAIIGYRFERALREADLIKYVDDFRGLFPLSRGNSGLSEGPAETVAARNVVDGLVLRTAWRVNGTGFVDALLPGLTSSERGRLISVLNEVSATLDAYGDLYTAESTFQFVRGNLSASAAASDALSGSGRPPDAEFANSPRGGSHITHRVSILFDGSQSLNTTTWPTGTASPRAIAEPAIDNWLGTLAGPSGAPGVKVWITHSPNPNPAVVALNAGDLGMRPVELLDLAGGDAESRQILERRILDTAFPSGQIPTGVEVHFAVPNGVSIDPDSDKTLAEYLDILAAARRVLGRSRALDDSSLTAMDGTEVESSFSQADAEANHAIQFSNILAVRFADLDSALSSGNATSLRSSLRALSPFVASAFPDPRWSQAELIARASVVRDALARKTTETGSVVEEMLQLMGNVENRPKLQEATTQLLAMTFDRGFRRLPRIVLVGGVVGELSTSFNARAGTSPDVLLKQASRTRSALADWRELVLRTQAGGSPAPMFKVGQLPHIDGEPWAGDVGRPAGSRLSLIATGLSGMEVPSFTTSIAGFVIDEWNEIIPNREEQTGVAFNYKKPGSEAPQAILVAVPSPGRSTWNFTTLLSTVNETLDHAKVRGVYADMLNESAQILPAIFLSANVKDDEQELPDDVTTDFSGIVGLEPTVSG
jgi:hypothetical protein